MFDRVDIYTYHRSGRGPGKRKTPRFIGTPSQKTEFGGRTFSLAWVAKTLTKEAFILSLVGFFLGRVLLLGELSPFGVAFTCAAAWLFEPLPLVAAAVMVGLFTVTEGFAFWSSVAVVAAAFLAMSSIKSQINRPLLVVPGLVTVVTLAVRVVFITVHGPALYSYITATFESFFAGVLTFIFLQCLEPFARGAVRKTLSGETAFCFMVLMAGIIAGTANLEYQFVTLRGVMSRLVILLGALTGGAGIGAASGAIVGVIPGFAFVVSPVIIGAFSFAGLLAGAARSFGKLAVAVGFLLGNILLSVYVSDYGNLKTVLAETAIATVLFLLVPAVVQEKIKEHLPGSSKEAPVPTPIQESRLRELTVNRIKDWSSVFSELSRSFEQVSSTVQKSQEEQGLQQLFAEVSKKVCEGCALYRTCWERDYYRTYQNLLDILSVVEIQGKISVEDLSDDLKKRCARLKEMCITITCLYETYKVNRYWQQRLLESRELVSEQLKGVSQIMESLSGELELDVELDGEIDEALKYRFQKLGIDIEDLYTLHKEDGLMEVGIVKEACRGEMECRFTIAPVVSKVVGRAFNVASTKCQLKEGEDLCTFKLYPALKYRLDIGVAKLGKDGHPISGDSYSIIELKEGRVALLLSDGMGTGPKAAKESGTVVSLLEHLLESGFGQDLAVRTVNSIMMLRSTEETFSTVDLVVLDLYTGNGTFLKIGAVPSYLARGKRVGIVKANALPVGVLENIQFTSVNRVLEEGDWLVMVTDGILDAYSGHLEKDQWMTCLLQELRAVNAQGMAEAILHQARQAAGGGIPDDMTVITARLEKSDS
ncbi:stage II sporulation protein E [Desulforamulus ruminis DSM 2154]|uniref:Stage II sporulation protein E n=1 Tax=Desulforamulus ruminis (strain ATCC 23193 / DSM 2154 / NCIMB 8452 / DL) TaxID=696281 RepID=F6DMT7_DESRL|nr:stage II sporulation protein E [Desulforamulus ruminis DSM 2154]